MTSPLILRVPLPGGFELRIVRRDIMDAALGREKPPQPVPGRYGP